MDKKNILPKVAFVGCGNIAHVHFRFLKKVGYQVNCVCDSSQIRVETFAHKYNIEKIYTDLDTLLSIEKPDIVHILTPPNTHYQLILKAIDAGCHVFVEKPFCQSVAEYQEISKRAAQKGLLISVDHTRVFNPMVVQAREVCRSGQFGKIVRMEYLYDDPSLNKFPGDLNGYRWARGVPLWFEKVPGGVVFDLLPHPLSVFLSFDSGLRIQSISSNIHANKIIDEVSVFLKSESVFANIHLSLNQKPLKNIFKIYCEKGEIFIDLRNMYSVIQLHRNLPGILSRVGIVVSDNWQRGTKFFLNVFKILTGRAHTYDGLDLIIKSFYEAVLAGDPQKLPELHCEHVTSLLEQIIHTSFQGNSLPQPGGEVDVRAFDQIDPKEDCLVLGGTGFIGWNIAQALLDDGKSIRVLCRSLSSAQRLPERVGRIFGDLRDPLALARSLDGIKTVVHCAAAMSGDWAEFYESTVKGTENLLKALEESSVEHLVYVSSLGVLDYNKMKNGEKVDEFSPLESKPADRGFYTKTKLEAEQLVNNFRKQNSRIKVTILRPGLVYGEESNFNLQNCGILLDKFLFVFGLGTRRLGLIYVENLASAIVSSVNSDFLGKYLLHLVDEVQPTVKEIVAEHNKHAPQKVIPIYVPIFLWRILFFAVDCLFYFKNKKIGTFRYRFASNSKILKFQSESARRCLGSYSVHNFNESYLRVFKKN